MTKIKGKVQKTVDLDTDLAEWVDAESKRLTRTARGRSAFMNEALKFTKANMAEFEVWWKRRN